MNKILLQIIIDCALFFELSDESDLDPDVAIQQLEQISSKLRELSKHEQMEVCDYIGTLASEPVGQNMERRLASLKQLPEALGLSLDRS